MPRLSFCGPACAGRHVISSKRATGKRVKFTRRSGARVKAIVHGSQPRLEHVRVDLRRRQVGVSEHHLDRAQIGAALEQVRREGMPEDVRAERAADAGAASVRLENLPEADARQRAAARVEKQARRRGWPRAFARRASAGRGPRAGSGAPSRRLLADRDEPFLVALADARQVLLVEMQIDGAHARRAPRRACRSRRGARASRDRAVRAPSSTSGCAIS